MGSIVFITDTWSEKNLNGVVTWIRNIRKQLEKIGFRVIIIHPELFFNFPLPTYSELKIAPFAKNELEKILRHEKPQYIHIATPGPLGFSAVKICLKNKWRFTTFYHTRLPEYIGVRFKPLEGLVYRYLRWFHNSGDITKVGTNSIKEVLEQKGFKNVISIPLGIDLTLFHRKNHSTIHNLKKPVFTYLGRIAPEKNIEAFLECDLHGSKLIIGDGPSRQRLERKYNGTALFVGHKNSGEVIDLLSASDVFVFPSKTDTFGLAILEALACGLPVAAYDVPGPKDIITDGKDGFLGNNLEENAKKCLLLNRMDCIKKSRTFSWENANHLFVKNLVTCGI